MNQKSVSSCKLMGYALFSVCAILLSAFFRQNQTDKLRYLRHQFSEKLEYLSSFAPNLDENISRLNEELTTNFKTYERNVSEFQSHQDLLVARIKSDFEKAETISDYCKVLKEWDETKSHIFISKTFRQKLNENSGRRLRTILLSKPFVSREEKFTKITLDFREGKPIDFDLPIRSCALIRNTHFRSNAVAPNTGPLKNSLFMNAPIRNGVFEKNQLLSNEWFERPLGEVDSRNNIIVQGAFDDPRRRRSYLASCPADIIYPKEIWSEIKTMDLAAANSLINARTSAAQNIVNWNGLEIQSAWLWLGGPILISIPLFCLFADFRHFLNQADKSILHASWRPFYEGWPSCAIFAVGFLILPILSLIALPETTNLWHNGFQIAKLQFGFGFLLFAIATSLVFCVSIMGFELRGERLISNCVRISGCNIILATICVLILCQISLEMLNMNAFILFLSAVAFATPFFFVADDCFSSEHSVQDQLRSFHFFSFSASVFLVWAYARRAFIVEAFHWQEALFLICFGLPISLGLFILASVIGKNTLSKKTPSDFFWTLNCTSNSNVLAHQNTEICNSVPETENSSSDTIVT